jgi:hypothetical protein
MINGCIEGYSRHNKYWKKVVGLDRVVEAIRSRRRRQITKYKIILKFLGGLPIMTQIVDKSGNSVQYKSPYRNPKSFAHFFGNILFLFGIAAIGIWWQPERPVIAWLAIMMLMAAFMVTFGHGITGSWRGVFIDGRYRISLGRLQLLAWTLVILSAIIAAAFHNLNSHIGSPLEISIPSQLWVLMGITTASAIASPAVLSNKRNLQPDEKERSKTEKNIIEQKQKAGEIVIQADEEKKKEKDEIKTIIHSNDSFDDARWGDLLKGDETGNAAAVDVGKIQMFFITFILVVAYGAAIGNLLAGDGQITALPPVDEGMNVLLGISHTGYVANKAVSHSREAAE